MKKWTRVMYQPNRPLKEGCYVTASKEHIALSREAATEGMVLLKNEHNLLPLKAGSRIALFGKGSFDNIQTLTNAWKMVELSSEDDLDAHTGLYYFLKGWYFYRRGK